MAGVRRTLPVVLTVGAGFVGYQYIYRSKHGNTLPIYDGITVYQPWRIRLYTRLPLNAASRLWGRLNNVDLPVWAREPVFSLYVHLFHCNMSEAAVTDLRHYQNVGELFRRRLRPECRPVDHKCPLTCPSDGVVLTCGSVSSNSVEQVKGVTYSLDRFLGPDDWPHVEEVKGVLYSLGQFLGLVSSTPANVKSPAAGDTDYVEHVKYHKQDTALYQAVIYLAPGDYHRFHSPTEWTVSFRRYFPGLLLSVNPYVARLIPGLLSLNERVVYVGEWRHGFVALAAVGATNVGSIRVYHDPNLHTNASRPSESHVDHVYKVSGHLRPMSFNRGDLFGEFNLGSTVVLLFEAPKNFQFSILPGQKVKYGQVLGQ